MESGGSASYIPVPAFHAGSSIFSRLASPLVALSLLQQCIVYRTPSQPLRWSATRKSGGSSCSVQHTAVRSAAGGETDAAIVFR